MGRYLVLGVLLLPIAEIALFIKAGQSFGLLPTLGLVIVAAIGGGMLLRHQGLSVLNQLRDNFNGGRLPARTVFDAMLVGLAAVLLVLPGFLSDLAALILLLPPVRGLIYRGLASRVVVAGGAAYRPAEAPRVSRPDTIDLDDDDYRPG